MISRTVDLPESMDSWVTEQVRVGPYSDESAYICALIGQDQEDQEKLEALRAAVRKGRESGPTDATMSDIIAEAQAELVVRSRRLDSKRLVNRTTKSTS